MSRWTKSNYAYLNQPAIESMDAAAEAASTYPPNSFPYKPISAVSCIFWTL